MNVAVSDTAEYWDYLFANVAMPLLSDFMKKIDIDVIGKGTDVKDNGVDNIKFIEIKKLSAIAV